MCGLICHHFWRVLQEDFQRGLSSLVALKLGVNRSAFDRDLMWPCMLIVVQPIRADLGLFWW